MENLVLYDGVCGLCDRSVQWILRHDAAGAFRFAPLQGPTAAAIRARHPEVPASLDSLMLVQTDGSGERIYWESSAVFRISRKLDASVRWLAVFRFVPRVLTDLVYRAVARSRYRIWGKLDACRVPSPEERMRFLP